MQEDGKNSGQKKPTDWPAARHAILFKEACIRLLLVISANSMNRIINLKSNFTDVGKTCQELCKES